MGYCSENIEELQNKAKFIRITNAGLQENHHEYGHHQGSPQLQLLITPQRQVETYQDDLEEDGYVSISRGTGEKA